MNQDTLIIATSLRPVQDTCFDIIKQTQRTPRNPKHGSTPLLHRLSVASQLLPHLNNCHAVPCMLQGACFCSARCCLNAADIAAAALTRASHQIAVLSVNAGHLNKPSSSCINKISMCSARCIARSLKTADHMSSVATGYLSHTLALLLHTSELVRSPHHVTNVATTRCHPSIKEHCHAQSALQSTHTYTHTGSSTNTRDAKTVVSHENSSCCNPSSSTPYPKTGERHAATGAHSDIQRPDGQPIWGSFLVWAMHSAFIGCCTTSNQLQPDTATLIRLPACHIMCSA
jgi:hypothetical protein